MGEIATRTGADSSPRPGGGMSRDYYMGRCDELVRVNRELREEVERLRGQPIPATLEARADSGESAEVARFRARLEGALNDLDTLIVAAERVSASDAAGMEDAVRRLREAIPCIPRTYREPDFQTAGPG